MNVRDRLPTARQAVVMVVVGSVLVSGGAIASSHLFGASGTVVWQSPNGPTVTTTTTITGTTSTPITSNEVDFGLERFTSPSPTAVTISGGYDSSKLQLTAIDTNGTTLTVDSAGKNTILLSNGVTGIDIQDVDRSSTSPELTVTGGSGTVAVQGLPSNDYVRVVYTNAPNEIVPTDGSGTATIQVASGDELSLANSRSPVVSNYTPTGGTLVNTSPVPLSVDVEDPDFATATGDTVTVEFRDASDDSTIGTATLIANGTATTDWNSVVGGNNSWYAVTNDSYGNNVQSQTFTFQFPSKLEIRDESAPTQLVNNTTSNATVRFFEKDGDEIVERTTSTGILDLTGLEPQRFAIEVAADGYVRRQALIDSITNQQRVYLLPENATTVTARFRLDDETGRFDESTSQIFIQRPIKTNGSITYQTVAASAFGPAGYTTELESDQRYRIKLRNAEGDTRILEPYSASVSETVTLEVNTLSFNQELDEPVKSRFTTNEDTSPSTVRFELKDETNSTENVDVKIYERGNESNVILNDTFAGPFGELVVTKQVPNSTNATQFAVDWTADRNGNELAAQKFSGANSLTSVAIPDWFGEAISVVILLVVAGAGSQVNAPTVGIGVVFTASILWFIGFLPAAVTGGVLAFGLAIPAFYLFSGNGGVR